MKAFKIKRSRSPVHKSRHYPLYAAIAVGLVLAVALTVTIIAKNRAQAQLDLGRQQLASQIQSNLNGAFRACEQMTLPGANVEGSLLPTMKQHMYAADEINRVMIDVYGRESSMIDGDIFSQIELAFTQIERSITEGQSITSAHQTLTSYMTQLETDLNARFAGTELLMSRGSLK